MTKEQLSEKATDAQTGPQLQVSRVLVSWASWLLDKVSPGNIAGILCLMFFILTFGRTVSEGGLLENCMQVDYFNILEGKSNIYKFFNLA